MNEGIYYNYRPLENDISLRNQMYGDWGIRSEDRYSVVTTYERGYLHIQDVEATELLQAFETYIYIYENSYQVSSICGIV